MNICIDALSITFPIKVSLEDNGTVALYDYTWEFLKKKLFPLFDIKSGEFGFEEVEEMERAPINYCGGYRIFESIYFKTLGPVNYTGYRTNSLVLMGKGCREYETRTESSLIDFIDYCVNHLEGKVSHIDLATDVMDNTNIKMDLLLKHIIYNKYYVSPIRTRRHVGSEENGHTIYLGNRGTNHLCIYDKRKERESAEYSVYIDNWIRFEMRFYDKAHNVALGVIENKNNLGQYAKGLLFNMLDIKQESNDSNKRRISTVQWWSRFLGKVEKIKVSSNQSEIESTISTNKKWFAKNVKKSAELIRLSMGPIEYEFYQMNLRIEGLRAVLDDNKALSKLNNELLSKGKEKQTKDHILDEISKALRQRGIFLNKYPLLKNVSRMIHEDDIKYYNIDSSVFDEIQKQEDEMPF